MCSLFKYVWKALLWSGALIFSLILWFSPAKAQYYNAIAAVQCDAAQSRVLVRFTVLDADAKLYNAPLDVRDFIGSGPPEIPAALATQWKNIHYRVAGKCDLRNGQDVSVSTIDGMVGLGFNEDTPNSYFKMSIDNHVVYDEYMFDNAFGSPAPRFNLSAIKYDGRSLLECLPPEPKQAGGGFLKPVCKDASDRLAPGTKFLTDGEKEAYDADLYRAQLAAEMTPFCSGIRPSVENYDAEKKLEVSFHNTKAWPDSSKISDALIHSPNDAQVEEVVLVAGTDNAFYGSYLMIFRGDLAGADKFETDLQSNVMFDLDHDPSGFALKRWGGHFISIVPLNSQSVDGGGFSRDYDTNDLLRVQDRYYVYSTPFDQNVVPSGILGELMPNNSIKVICTFP